MTSVFKKNKKCQKCERNLDEKIKICPHCGYVFTDDNECFDKIFWFDSIRQILFFLIGSIGLLVLSFFISLIFSFLKTVDQTSEIINLTEYNLLNSSICYLCIFGVFVILSIPYLKSFLKLSLKLKPVLKGLLFGLILILISFLYSFFIQNVFKLNSNENQSLLVDCTLTNPLVSIIIFSLIGPIVEEFTYRIGLFSFLNRFSSIISYVITTLIFGLIHFDFSFSSSEALLTELANIPIYLFSGFLLCFIYKKEGPIASISAHILNNLVSITSILIIGRFG